MQSEPDPHRHPVVAFALAVRAAAKDVVDVEPTFMTAAQKAEALDEILQAEAQLAGLRMRVMAVAEDVAEEHAARDVAAWVSSTTRMVEYSAARSDQELARRLDRRWRHVARALSGGDVSMDQARAIVHALDQLPDDLAVEIADEAESALVGHAPELRPAQLRRLGRRILEVVAPEIADAEEARRLRAEEERAGRAAHLDLRPLGDGTTRIIGILPDLVAARLKTYLESYTSPRHRPRPPDARAGSDFGPPRERVPYRRRMAEAFAALLEHLDPGRLPRHGGDATTLMVTISLDQLRTDLAAAGLVDGDLSDGFDLTADQARRLACNARIIPVVLGGDGEILDLGRSARLFSGAQRKAMRLRDRRCRAEGCTVPATWREAHHLHGWAVGGRTDLADGVLLCSWHHHRAHDPAYSMQLLPDGDHRYHRRT